MSTLSSSFVASPPPFTSFGDLLRFLRRRAHLTQYELALAVDYCEAQISRLEKNLRRPDSAVVKDRFISALQLENEPETVAQLLKLAAHAQRVHKVRQQVAKTSRAANTQYAR